MKRILTYLRTILVPVLVWAIVWIIMNSYIDYEKLIQPFLAPPSIAFPIVWTILYILMWLSHWILVDKKLMTKNLSILYYVQLWVNALWSIIFFILKWRFIAIIWIILLDVLVLVMIIKMFKKSKLSAMIQIPYLLWISFATYLTIMFYVLNK